MQPHFDSIAEVYDAEFTHTPVGMAQRAIVWKHLNNTIGPQPLKILELNCGTGEDAIMLAAKGHQVTATDISANMLAIADGKAKTKGHTIHTLKWDFNQPFPLNDRQFDLIFSNFGGLNCIAPEKLDAVFATLNNILTPGGQCIFVVMGKYCMMESVYFLCTFQFSNIFRRKHMQNVPIGNNVTVPTWYYSPTALQHAAQLYWKKKNAYPVGLFIPPSYMNAYFERHTTLFKLLKRCDRFCQNISMLSNFSDHYYISFSKR